MTFASNVSPPKRSLREKPSAWVCACLKGTVIRPGYLARCLDCKMDRP